MANGEQQKAELNTTERLVNVGESVSRIQGQLESLATKAEVAKLSGQMEGLAKKEDVKEVKWQLTIAWLAPLVTIIVAVILALSRVFADS